MKLHRHLVTATIQILQGVFGRGAYSDKALEAAFKAHPKWGARDRHFVAETVYEVVRWWRRLWYLLDISPTTDSEDLLLLLCVHWTIAGEELPGEYALDQKLTSQVFSRKKSLRLDSAIFHSLPDWLHELGVEELGDRWKSVAEGLNKKAEVVLRVNSLRTTKKAAQERLATEDQIQTRVLEDYPDALVLTKRANIFRTGSFKDGWIEAQDAASQLVAAFLDPKPSERIVDTCAGAGGKSLHLAALMKNKGKIISLDIHEWKLQELKKRAARDGVDIIETRPIDSMKVVKRLENSFDAALLDVPCSGLGALRRNPDTKWKLTKDKLKNLNETQAMILRDYQKLVKKGGRLVYATCSVLPSENERQVESFLAENSEWTLEKEHHEWPDQQGFDGFYMALLKRSN